MNKAVKALFDAVQETVEQIAPSSGADPTPLSGDDAATLILWTYQVLRDDLGAADSPPPTPREPLTVTYTNYAGKTAERHIVPERLWYGTTEWHPGPGWLLDAFDIDKHERRSFSLSGFDVGTVLTLPGRQSSSIVRPEDISAEIKALIDERAGREHSADGPVMTTLAEVLTLWEKLR